MDVKDLEAKFKHDEKTEVLIFNPLPYDVDWQYDGQKQDPIPSKENISLKPSRAKVLGNKLVSLYMASKDKNYPREKAERLVFGD